MTRLRWTLIRWRADRANRNREARVAVIGNRLDAYRSTR